VIKKISSVQIDSIIYERIKNDNTEGLSNKLFVSTSMRAASFDNLLSKKNLRLFVSTDPDTIKAMDYVSQRYNEYLSMGIDSLSVYDFNRFLQRTLESKDILMKSSNPFFPMSTDIEARDLVITNGVSSFGDGSIITKDVIIYDVPLEQVAHDDGTGFYIIDPISLMLPDTTETLQNISLYAFIYDTRVPNLNKKDPIENFSLTTGATLVSRSTPVGTRTLYVAITPEKPLLGMSEAEVINQPDAARLRTIENNPDEIVLKRYTNITDRMGNVFTQASLVRNYELKKSLNNKNYFSDLWVARGHNESHKLVFGFDLRSYLADNAIFPFVFKSERLSVAAIQGTDPLSVDQLSRVLSTSVNRRYIKPAAKITNNTISTLKTKDKTQDLFYPEVPVFNVKRVSIGIPSLSAGSQIEFYEAYDNFDRFAARPNQISGDVAYSTTCVVYDNSPLLVRNIAFVLSSYKQTVKSIVERLTYLTVQPGEFASIEIVVGNTTTTVRSAVLSIIDDYQTIINAINSDFETQELIKYYEEILIPGNTSLKLEDIQQIENILDLGIHFIHQQLEKIFPNDPLGRRENNTLASLKANFSKSVQRPITQVSNSYPKSYSVGKNTSFGMDYIFEKDNTEGINTLAVSDYTTRRREEFKKYFSAGGEEQNPEPAGTYRNPSYAYMSPKLLVTPNRPVVNQGDTAINGDAVNYDYNRYIQLFNDIVEVKERIQDVGERAPYLSSIGSDQNIPNKSYSSVLKTLNDKFSLTIGEDPQPQFAPPRVDKGDPKTTFYDANDNTLCGVGNRIGLIAGVIGGKGTTNENTKTYLDNVDKDIKNTDSASLSGSLDRNAALEDAKDRSLKLPFLLFGELSIDTTLINRRTNLENVYNSLTELKNILNLTSQNVAQSIQGDSLSSLPNQLKSMIVISTDSGIATLSSGDGSTQYQACRPVVLDGEKGESSDLVSIFNNDQDIPPFPLVEDPMKSYAKFLTFWMNYRQIAVIEYLDNFGSLRVTPGINQRVNNKLKLDEWATLTPEILDLITEADRSILCRARTMEPTDYLELFGTDLSSQERESLIRFFKTKEEINLPAYNKYFYIK